MKVSIDLMKKFANLLRSFSCNDIGHTIFNWIHGDGKLKPLIRLLCIYVRKRRGCMIFNSRPLYVLRLSTRELQRHTAVHELIKMVEVPRRRRSLRSPLDFTRRDSGELDQRRPRRVHLQSFVDCGPRRDRRCKPEGETHPGEEMLQVDAIQFLRLVWSVGGVRTQLSSHITN